MRSPALFLCRPSCWLWSRRDGGEYETLWLDVCDHGRDLLCTHSGSIDVTSMMEVARLSSGTILEKSLRSLMHLVQLGSKQLVMCCSRKSVRVRLKSSFSTIRLRWEFAKVMATREAGLKTFTLEEQKTFELGLVERMTQTFSKDELLNVHSTQDRLYG